MKVTRLRFRIVEMIFGPLALLFVDGLTHVYDGKPFMGEFLWGGFFAIFIVRGLDVIRAAANQWPEQE